MGQGSSTAAAGDPTEGLLLAYALDEGHPETAELFLAKNPALAFHVDDQGNTPMHFAARSGSVHAVQVLLHTLRASAASNTWVVHGAEHRWHALHDPARRHCMRRIWLNACAQLHLSC